MKTNATLTYIEENKVFQYVDGQYKTTGNKVVSDGRFSRVDNGDIQKDDAFIGSYNYSVENGVMKNLWMNINDPSEATTFLVQLNECFTALNAENSTE